MIVDINDFCDRAERALLFRHTEGEEEESDWTAEDEKLAKWERDRDSGEEN